jgi:1,4-alpha-glucan branching enzyme
MTQQNENSAKNTTGEQNANKIVSGGGKKDERSKLASFEQNPYESEHFVDTSKPVWNYSLLTDEDVRNYQAGTNYSLYEKFGSHSIKVHDVWGMYFCVWAPNATSVSVTGNFNHWKNHEHELYPRWDRSGIWEGFIPGLNLGESYKYYIVGFGGKEQDKGDPFANFWEKRPLTASITWDMHYEWKDEEWMNQRKDNNSLESPWSVYEVHLASWMRPDKNDEETYNTYDQIRERLVPLRKRTGFYACGVYACHGTSF